MQKQSLILKQEREKKEQQQRYSQRYSQLMQESELIRKSCSDLSGLECLDASGMYVGNTDVLTNIKKKELTEFMQLTSSDHEYGKEENIIYDHSVETKITEETVGNPFKCQACMKSFSNQWSLNRHLERFPACVKWIELVESKLKVLEKSEIKQNIQNNIHIISIRDLIDDMFIKAITDNINLQRCKYCNTQFSSTYNINKHFKTAIPCNKLAITELKRMINKIEL